MLHTQVERPVRAGRSSNQNRAASDGRLEPQQPENEEWESARRDAGLLVDYTARFVTKVFPAGKRIFNSTNLPPVPVWCALYTYIKLVE